MSQLIKTFLIAFAMSGLFVSAYADPAQSAEAVITDTIEALEDDQGAEVADTVLKHVNTRAIAGFVLGQHSSKVDDQDKVRFATALESYLRRQITANAGQIAGVGMQVIRTDQRNARDAIVTTRIQAKDGPITLRWRLIERSGAWSVIDLEFSGIWLAIEQRAQVSSILGRPGADIEDVIAQFG